jgi:hypothetical protein
MRSKQKYKKWDRLKIGFLLGFLVWPAGLSLVLATEGKLDARVFAPAFLGSLVTIAAFAIQEWRHGRR